MIDDAWDSTKASQRPAALGAQLAGGRAIVSERPKELASKARVVQATESSNLSVTASCTKETPGEIRGFPGVLAHLIWLLLKYCVIASGRSVTCRGVEPSRSDSVACIPAAIAYHAPRGEVSVASE